MSRLLPLRYCSDRFARSSHGYTCYPFIYPSVYNEVLYVCSVVNSVQHANYHCTSVQLLYKCSVSIPSEQCSDYEHLFSVTATPPLPPQNNIKTDFGASQKYPDYFLYFEAFKGTVDRFWLYYFCRYFFDDIVLK